MSTPSWAIESPDQITAAWAAELLGHPVAEVLVEQVGTGQIGTCYRVSLAGAPDLPARVLVKLPAPDAGARELLKGVYRSEVTFYDRLAPTLAARVPTVHASRLDEDSGHFVLALEDLSPLVQGDQVAGATPAQVLDAAVNLAGVHGPRWSDPTLLEVPGLALNTQEDADTLAELYGPTMDLFVDGLGDRLAPEDVEVLRGCVPGVAAWALARQDERYGVLHGDYRLDNLMFTEGGGPGEVAALDWQTISLALPARDLAYLVATSLDPADRRAVEREVVAAYHARLVELGVRDYDLETCWDDYVFALPQGPLVASFGCAYGTRTERGDAMFAAMTRRACAAIRDLGSLDMSTHR